MYSKLLTFLFNIIRSDDSVTRHIKQLSIQESSYVICKEDEFCITLPMLYELLYDDRDGSFGQFQSMLYHSDINCELKTHGYQAELAESEHDSNNAWYCLTRLEH